MELLYSILVTSCGLFWNSSSRASRFHAWPWIWLLAKSGYVKGSCFSLRFVQEGCHRDTEFENSSPVLLWLHLCGQAAHSSGREGWAGREPGNLWKCFSTFAFDNLVVFKWTISALMISCFQVCIHLKGLILYKNCMGVTLVRWHGHFCNLTAQHWMYENKGKRVTQAGAGCWPRPSSYHLFSQRTESFNFLHGFWLFYLISTDFKEGGRTSPGINQHMARVWLWAGL